MEPRSADLLVKNAYVATMDDDRRVLTNGAIAIEAGAIAAIGPDAEVSTRFEAERVIDVDGALVHPGFVDNHIHLDYHNLRWATEDGGGWDETAPIHGEYMGIIDERLEYVSGKLASLEMARNGTTCFLESGGITATDAAATAIEEVGIRGMLGDSFIRDHGSGKTIPQDAKRAFKVLGGELKRNKDPNALVRGVVSISGMGSCTDELMLAAKAMADEHGVILNQHQSYAAADAAADDERFGQHPLVHYAEMGVLDKNCMFAHMNIIRDDEIEPIVQSGMSMAWCPMASMLFGVGGTIHGRHLELHRLGANVAFGCDSANWTSAFDVGEQAFIAVLTAREKTGSAEALTAEDVLQMATINGAQAVGLADQIGSLEVGKRADLVIRSVNMPEAHPGLDPIRSAIYSSRSKSVDTVIVDGQVIVENGRSTRIDEEALYAESRDVSRKVLKKLGRVLPAGRWPRVR